MPSASTGGRIAEIMTAGAATTIEPNGQVKLSSPPPLLAPVDESVIGGHGEVFTRRWVVEMILDLCGYTEDADLATKVAIEPSCGSGSFLEPMVARLLKSIARFGHDPEDCFGSIKAFDLLQRNTAAARDRTLLTLTEAELDPVLAERLADAWISQADFLLEPPEFESADFVI